MSKLNASKISERLRQVPTLKIIFLKELTCRDLYRSLLKTDRFFVMILSFYFSFVYIEHCTIYKGGIYEIDLQFIFMDKLVRLAVTLGSHPRVLL